MTESVDRVATAREAVLERLHDVEVALDDLTAIELVTLEDLETKKFQKRLRLRVTAVASCLDAIEDALRRLFRRIGRSTDDLEAAIEASPALRITRRLVNSRKHGLGGRKRNATIFNGILSVRRDDGNPDEQGRPRALILGMLVVDGEDGPIPSHQLFAGAIRAWAALLDGIIDEAAEWSDRRAPKPKGTLVIANPGEKPVIPAGATIEFPFDPAFVKGLIGDVNRRADRA